MPAVWCRCVAVGLVVGALPLVLIDDAPTGAAVAPAVTIEPAVGTADGPVTVTGHGFTAGQSVLVTNEKTGTQVCATTAATDGTFACNGVAGAKPGTTSSVGVGTTTTPYQAIGAGGIATVAGGGIADGDPSRQATVAQPDQIAADAAGNVYFVDSGANVVRRIDRASGVITTVAGVPFVPNPSSGGGGYAGDGVKALGAELNDPTGVAIDQAGNVFIADYGNNRVREVVAATGLIKTVAGDGSAGDTGDGGPATAASLDGPESVAVDRHGNVFIADRFNCIVREVTATTKLISTVVGDRTCGFAGDNGPATSAELGGLSFLAVDGAGDLYVADYLNNRVRKVAAGTGIITTIAGTGACAYSGNGGPATSAGLCLPQGLAVDGHGNLYIADSNNWVIRRVSATGVITTVAGNGSDGYRGDGKVATAAALGYTSGIAVDAAGDLFVASFDFNVESNNNIRAVSGTTDIITTLVNGASPKYGGDGYGATAARASGTSGLALDPGGNIYFSDYYTDRVRKVDVSTGRITTVAGSGNSSTKPLYGGDGGPATKADIYEPLGLAVDTSGDLFIADFGNNRVREVNASTGIITTVAGNGTAGYSGDHGAATSAELSGPTAVAVDSKGNLFIYDSNNSVVREVATGTGIITTVATGLASGEGGVAVDSTGHLYVTNNGLEVVTLATDTTTTVPGVDSGDTIVAMGRSGVVYLAGQTNYIVQKVVLATNAVTTVAGIGTNGYAGDGGPAVDAKLYQVMSLAADPLGNVFIGTLWDGRVREVPG